METKTRERASLSCSDWSGPGREFISIENFSSSLMLRSVLFVNHQHTSMAVEFKLSRLQLEIVNQDTTEQRPGAFFLFVRGIAVDVKFQSARSIEVAQHLLRANIGLTQLLFIV
jgi:hypothetical protein